MTTNEAAERLRSGDIYHVTVQRPGHRPFTYRYAEVTHRFQSSIGPATTLYQAWRGRKPVTVLDSEIRAVALCGNSSWGILDEEAAR